MTRKKRRTQNPKNVTVSLSPWTDQDEKTGVHFSLFRLHVQESLYGEIPSGEAELVHSGTDQEALEMIKNQETGTIEIQDNKEGGFHYKFNIFITKRNFYNEILSLEFICIPGNDEDKNTLERGIQFYTKLLSETYSNIEDAVNSSYPGNKKRIKVETNIPDTTKIYRDNETSYDFVKRLCYSWKNECVFAFGWDGLLIKEIIGINSFEDDEKDNEKIKKVFGDQKEWTQLTKSILRYNIKNNTKLFNPWQDPYKDEEENDLLKSVTPDNKYKDLEENLRFVTSSITGERKYFIHGKDYSVLSENRKSCEVFSESKGYGSLVLLGRDMPRDWRLGDVILYSRKKDDGRDDVSEVRLIVASNELFFSQNGSTKTGPHGLPFEWVTTFWKVEKGPWSKELEENKENKETNE